MENEKPLPPLSSGEKVICFLLPIIGLIIYFVTMNNNPHKSKEAGQYSLLGVVFGTVLYFALNFKV